MKFTPFEKGHIPWNKGRVGVYSKETLDEMRNSHLGKKYKPMSDQGKENVRQAKIGTKLPLSARMKMSAVRKGRKQPLSQRKKLSLFQGKLVKEGRHNFYKGGLVGINQRIRDSLEYRLWREAVFKRDGFRCVLCSQASCGNLEADHIKAFATHPELRFEVSNGRTLCKPCHRNTETFGVGWHKNRPKKHHRDDRAIQT